MPDLMGVPAKRKKFHIRPQKFSFATYVRCFRKCAISASLAQRGSPGGRGHCTAQGDKKRTEGYASVLDFSLTTITDWPGPVPVLADPFCPP